MSVYIDSSSIHTLLCLIYLPFANIFYKHSKLLWEMFIFYIGIICNYWDFVEFKLLHYKLFPAVTIRNIIYNSAFLV